VIDLLVHQEFGRIGHQQHRHRCTGQAGPDLIPQAVHQPARFRNANPVARGQSWGRPAGLSQRRSLQGDEHEGMEPESGHDYLDGG
jgi:hypothetical protein